MNAKLFAERPSATAGDVLSVLARSPERVTYSHLLDALRGEGCPTAGTGLVLKELQREGRVRPTTRQGDLWPLNGFYDRDVDVGPKYVEVLPEPQTQAQARAWESVQPDCAKWSMGESRRDGANYVYVFSGRYGDDPAPAGKHRDSDDGRRLEIVIGPEGTEVARREYRTAPEANR
jgi:hypothetical protein